MTRRALKSAPLVRWATEDGLRIAVVSCPFCEGSHRHVVPLDVLADAPLIRMARCSHRGDYSIDIGTADKSSVA